MAVVEKLFLLQREYFEIVAKSRQNFLNSLIVPSHKVSYAL